MSFLEAIGVSGLVDILVIWVFLYAVILWLQRTRRAGYVLGGILIVGVVYLLSRQFDLRLTSMVLQGFFAVFLIALIVIFQEELRHLFEQVAHWSLRQRIPFRRSAERTDASTLQDLLVRTMFDLAKTKTGALVVLKGRDTLARHLEGGVPLRGDPSEAILKSIFDPGSIGHDGAVVIENSIISSFGCHLPLSRDHKKVGRRGTRHAAGLGLSELCDALSIIVSEERGAVSVARHGTLDEVTPEQLKERLDAFLEEVAPARRAPWSHVVTRNWWQKLASLVLAGLLYLVLIFGAEPVTRSFAVTLEPASGGESVRVAGIEPATIRVHLSGPRKSFMFLDSGRFRIRVPVAGLGAGTHVFTLQREDVDVPEAISVDRIEPDRVRIRLGP